MLLQRAGIHTGQTPVSPEIDTDGRLPGEFASGFLRAARLHYPVPAERITPEQLDSAVRQMHQAQRLFYDPSGWKGRLVLGMLQPFSSPRRTPDWDVLNVSRQSWIDPTDRTTVYRDSALELWDRALEDARETTTAALLWLEAGSDETEAERLRARFSELLGNISYETGRPCGSADIVYADSIVPER